MTRRSWNAVAICAVAAAAWGAVLLAIADRRLAGDVRGFILPGLRWYHSAAFDDIAIFGARGYDGEFYAMLAPDPLLLREDTAWGLDSPIYRARRVGVPLAAWLLAGGHGATAIRLYQLLCWGLALVGIGVVAAWLRASDRSPWWALVLAPSAGLAVSILRTTPDGAAAGLIVTALFLHHRERHRAALLAVAVATLVRETSLLAALAIAWSEWRAGRRRSAIAFGLVPLALLTAWQVRLMLRFGWGAGAPFDVVERPLSWVGPKLRQIADVSPPWLSIEVWATLAVLLAIAASLVFLLGRSRTAAERTLLLFSCLALVLGWKVYVEAFASARALAVIPPLALIVAAAGPGLARRLGLGAAVACSAVAGGLLVRQMLLEARTPTIPIRIAANVAAPAGVLANSLPADLHGTVRSGDGSLAIEPFVHDPPGGPTRRRTDLEVAAETPAAVVFELLRADGRNYPWPCRIRLEAGQTARLADAPQRLFGSNGSFGLRVSAESGAATLRWRVRDDRPGAVLPPWSAPFVLDSEARSP
ncbi:MAG: hypothetical protein HY825_06740 [Acidobacteria bacterium]|nr:hypothetical protein [Acidobacteriota bacterium]